VSSRVHKQNFLGDLINAFLLRDPYRESATSAAEPEVVTKAELDDDNVVTTAASALVTAQAFKAAKGTALPEESIHAATQLWMAALGEETTPAALRIGTALFQNAVRTPAVDAAIRQASLSIQHMATPAITNALGDIQVDVANLMPSLEAINNMPTFRPSIGAPTKAEAIQQLSEAMVLLASTTSSQQGKAGRLSHRPIQGRRRPNPASLANKIVLDSKEEHIAKLLALGTPIPAIAKRTRRSLGYTLRRVTVLMLKFDVKSPHRLREELKRGNWTTSEAMAESIIRLKGSSHKHYEVAPIHRENSGRFPFGESFAASAKKSEKSEAPEQ
jgi:hypothetical protein